MKRDKEQELIAAVEADLDDPEAWEDDPAPGSAKPLGSVISIRLDPEMHARLRARATKQGIGYSALVRQWIEDRLTSTPPDLSQALELINHTLRSADWAALMPPAGWPSIWHEGEQSWAARPERSEIDGEQA